MLLRLLRLLLPALVSGLALGLFGAAAPATAGPGGDTTCPPQTVAASTKAATAVFSGQVNAITRLAKPQGQTGATFMHSVTVTRVYQGQITTATVQVATDLTPKICSIGKLEVGGDYMFFVTGDGNPWVAPSGGGTTLATPAEVATVAQILGTGREPVKPAPRHAEFTPLHPPAPARLSRVAAPGLALVLIGLLGLLVVRGTGRRAR